MAWWNRKSIVKLLSECCICRTQACVMFPSVQSMCVGEFVGLDEESLTLNLYPERAKDFRVDCICCVSFNHDYRPHAFLTLVAKHGEEQSGKPRTLVLRIPPQVLSEKRRVAYRIPVSSESELVVRVSNNKGTTWTPAARDVSVAGMLLEFEDEADPELSVGDRIDVSLQLASNEVQLRGEVKRRDHTRYGLCFPDVVSGNTLHPPTDLTAIIRVLERQWYEGSHLARTADLIEASLD